MVEGVGSEKRSPLGSNAILATLGLAFVWQLFRHACVSVALPFSASACSLSSNVWMLGYYALVCILALAVAGFAKVRDIVSNCRSVTMIVCGIASVSVAVGCLVPDCGTIVVVPIVQGISGAFLAGATVLLVCNAARFFSLQARTNPALMMSCAFSSSFLSIVITFVLGDILSASVLTAIVSPIVAALCFWFVRDDKPEAPMGSSDSEVLKAIKGRTLAVVAILVSATLAKAFFDIGVGPVGEQGRMVKHIVGIVEVAGVMVLAFACTDTRRFVISTSYLLLCSLVLGIGLVTVGSDSLMHTGLATVVSARVLGESAVLALCAVYCVRSQADPFKVCCMMLLVPEMLACLVGYGSATLLPMAGFDAGQAVVPVCVFLIVTISLTAFVAALRRELQNTAIRSVPLLVLDEMADRTDIVPDGPFEALAFRFALTPREVDIARHLHRGYSAKRISEIECLSINTVQTHSRTLYRKLGIHSRQELDDLIVEETR